MSCYKCIKEKYCPYIHYFNLDKNVGCIEFQDRDNTTHISNTLNKEYDLGTANYRYSSKLYLTDDIKSIVYEDKEYDIKSLEALNIIKESIPIEGEDFFYDKETDTYFFIGRKVSREQFYLLKEVLLCQQ